MLSFLFLLLFYVFFLCVSITIVYYVRLFPSKDSYSRQDLFGVGIFFVSIAKGLTSRFGVLPFITSFFSISALAVLFSTTADHWIFNTVFTPCIVSAAILILSPSISSSPDRKNTFFSIVTGFISRYTFIIPFAYLCGFSAALSFLRAVDRISFSHYGFNLLIAVAMMVFFFSGVLKRYYDTPEN